MTSWWQNGIIYQIYPRSYQDSNGDGIGDIPGIIGRLDYLEWLGIDAIWVSPIYPSPMADFGYDVSDYTDVHPMFGTLADLDNLIREAHRRDIRVILDFVPNHSSDQHPWFLESRADRDNPKRDWYIWRDPAPGGGPPNNWVSRFDGLSAWEWDDKTGQYYLHSFRNSEVRRTMLDVVRFWFNRGIDGFRVDVSERVLPDTQFRDNPANPDWREGMDPSRRLLEKYTVGTPENHQFNRWIRAVADEYDDKVLIGEIYMPLSDLVKHYGQGDEFHLPFNFHLILSEWNPATVRRLADVYEGLLPEGAWPNWVLGNHDQHRVASRIGRAQARVAMMLLLTLRGTPTIYYGDEIGMEDGHIPADRIQDPWEKQVPGLGLGRDPERTPMQWENRPNAGFCDPDTKPWLPVTLEKTRFTVADQERDPGSMLSLTQHLIAIRRQHTALTLGDYKSLDAPDNMFLYLRQSAEERILVALNFSDQPVSEKPPEDLPFKRLLKSTYCDTPDVLANGVLHLRADEGVILSIGDS
jgi:alpha-glucosidase